MIYWSLGGILGIPYWIEVKFLPIWDFFASGKIYRMLLIRMKSDLF